MNLATSISAKKVLVTGNAGSGKTSLAADLSHRMNIAASGLDKIVWQAGWVKTPREEKRRRIQEVVSRPEWIVDGVSHQVFDAAETIVFLDLPLHRCLANVLKRFLKNGFKTRASLPADCPEWRGVWLAIKICFLYQRITRPQILERIARAPDKQVIRITSHRQLNGLLA